MNKAEALKATVANTKIAIEKAMAKYPEPVNHLMALVIVEMGKEQYRQIMFARNEPNTPQTPDHKPGQPPGQSRSSQR